MAVALNALIDGLEDKVADASPIRVIFLPTIEQNFVLKKQKRTSQN